MASRQGAAGRSASRFAQFKLVLLGKYNMCLYFPDEKQKISNIFIGESAVGKVRLSARPSLLYFL